MQSHSENNITLVKKYNFRGVIIIRDSRDQLVAMARIMGQKNIIEKINLLLQSYRVPGNWYRPNASTIYDYYNLYIPWTYEPNIYATHYELLVGPQGGRSKSAQLKEIYNIANHLEIQINEEMAENIAKNVYGGTVTFRVGQIGSWKKYFNEEHKKVFKAVAGQLLIDLEYERDFD